MIFKKILNWPYLIYITTIVWFSLIFYGTLKPASTFAKFQLPIPYLDKIIHFLMFLGVSFLVMYWRSIRKRDFQSFKLSATIGIVISFIMGLGIEILQSTSLVNRGFEWADLFADMLGALVGVYLFVKMVMPNIIDSKTVL